VDGLTDGICKIIIPNQEGGFLIEGLAGAGHFQKVYEADTFAREQLARMVRDPARAAGTSSRVVELKIEVQIPTAAGQKNGRSNRKRNFTVSYERGLWPKKRPV
jgi:hypothetical protein